MLKRYFFFFSALFAPFIDHFSMGNGWVNSVFSLMLFIYVQQAWKDVWILNIVTFIATKLPYELPDLHVSLQYDNTTSSLLA